MQLQALILMRLMKGLHDGMGEYGDADLEKNPAYRYAVARRILQNEGYDVELFVNYEMQMQMIAEWWKQLIWRKRRKRWKRYFTRQRM